MTSLSEGKIDLVTLGDTAPAAARERASLRRLGRVRWGLAAGFVLLLIVASAVFAPWIAPHDPLAVNIRHRLGPPAWMDGGVPASMSSSATFAPALIQSVLTARRSAA